MYELARKAREDMKSKAKRMVSGNSGDLDASGWREATDMHPDVKTGERPVSKQGFEVDGAADKPRADRKPRKSGGRVAEYVNRDVKEANEDRAGKKFDGGFKRGGRTGKMGGGQAALIGGLAGLGAEKLMKSAGGSLDGGSRPTGGREAHASGGKTHWIKDAIKKPGALHRELGVPEDKKIPAKKLEKAAEKGGKEGKRARLAETLERMPHKSGGKVGKTNINIIIGGPKEAPPEMPPPAAPMMPPKPPIMPPPMAGPPPGGPPPMGGGPMGGGMPPPMPRKSGGRTYPIEDGAGGGKGRMEKIEAYGK